MNTRIMLSATASFIIGVLLTASVAVVWVRWSTSNQYLTSQVADQSASSTSGINSANTAQPSAGQLADCDSGTPVIDQEGNPSAAVKTATHVYGEDCYVLADADPGTFVALDYYYGKDANGVWLLGSPTDEGNLLPARITGADPTTFALIFDPNYDSAEADEPFSGLFTKDKNYVYAYGQVVPGADPKTFVIDDPPDVGTCEFDGNDGGQKYWGSEALPPP